MLGGIIVQLGTFTRYRYKKYVLNNILVASSLYSILAVEFLIRYVKDRPVRRTDTARGELDKRVKLMICGLSFSTVCLFIR